MREREGLRTVRLRPTVTDWTDWTQQESLWQCRERARDSPKGQGDFDACFAWDGHICSL